MCKVLSLCLVFQKTETLNAHNSLKFVHSYFTLYSELYLYYIETNQSLNDLLSVKVLLYTSVKMLQSIK